MASADGWIDVTGDGGLLKKILVEGITPENPSEEPTFPTNGSEVTVHYVGTLSSDGSKFDSSRDRNDPFKFKLGQGQVIQGWDKGVITMKRNEKAILKLRSDYAYGASGSPPKIPPNAELLFEVELLDWNSWDTVGPRSNRALIKKQIIQTAPDSYNYAKDGAKVTITFTRSILASERATSGGNVVESKTNFTAVIGDDENEIRPQLAKCLKTMNKGEKAKFKIAPNTAPFGNSETELYTVEMIDFVPFNVDHLSTKQKLEYSEKRRNQGNAYFKASKLDLARRKYNKSLKAVDDAESFAADEADKTAAQKARISCHSNLAAVFLKLAKYTDAVSSAASVLEEDPNNVKALYRRGQAQRFLENFEEAKKSLEQALQIEPGNKEVRAEYDKVFETIKKQKQQQKRLYSKMFAALGQEEEAPKVAEQAAPAAEKMQE